MQGFQTYENAKTKKQNLGHAVNQKRKKKNEKTSKQRNRELGD